MHYHGGTVYIQFSFMFKVKHCFAALVTRIAEIIHMLGSFPTVKFTSQHSTKFTYMFAFHLAYAFNTFTSSCTDINPKMLVGIASVVSLSA